MAQENGMAKIKKWAGLINQSALIKHVDPKFITDGLGHNFWVLYENYLHSYNSCKIYVFFFPNYDTQTKSAGHPDLYMSH